MGAGFCLCARQEHKVILPFLTKNYCHFSVSSGSFLHVNHGVLVIPELRKCF